MTEVRPLYPDGHRYTRGKRYLAGSIPHPGDEINDDRRALRAAREALAQQPHGEVPRDPGVVVKRRR